MVVGNDSKTNNTNDIKEVNRKDANRNEPEFWTLMARIPGNKNGE